MGRGFESLQAYHPSNNLAEVTRAFEGYGSPYSQEFVPALVSLILKVIREPRFPKKHEAQFGVLADSLAGRAG